MMNRRELIKNIYEILEEEAKNNPVSYNKEKPYQAYERIGLKGLRWSVEKRISEYKLQRFFDKEHTVLDIGSNTGFFTVEFAHECKMVHGIEPNKWLNEIGLLTADFLNVAHKVKFLDMKFFDYEATANYNVVLSLAAFFTQDGRERSDASEYFGRIHDHLKIKGELFYESTSYTKDNSNPHYQAKRAAILSIHKNFRNIQQWETPSGSPEYFRQFAIAQKQ